MLHYIYRSSELSNVLTLLLLAVIGLSFGLWFFQIADHVNGGPRQIHYMAQYYAMKTYYKNRLIEGCIQGQTLQSEYCEVTEADIDKGPDLMSENVEKFKWKHGDEEYPIKEHNLDMMWMVCDEDVSDRFGKAVRRFTRREMELAIKISEVGINPLNLVQFFLLVKKCGFLRY